MITELLLSFLFTDQVSPAYADFQVTHYLLPSKPAAATVPEEVVLVFAVSTRRRVQST